MGRFKKEGIYVDLWLIIVVWQKSAQHCKAIIIQSKINFLKKLLPFILYQELTVLRSLTISSDLHKKRMIFVLLFYPIRVRKHTKKCYVNAQSVIDRTL